MVAHHQASAGGWQVFRTADAYAVGGVDHQRHQPASALPAVVPYQRDRQDDGESTTNHEGLRGGEATRGQRVERTSGNEGAERSQYGYRRHH